MEHKQIAEEIHFSLKELFEICEEVIYKESKYRENESSRGGIEISKSPNHVHLLRRRKSF